MRRYANKTELQNTRITRNKKNQIRLIRVKKVLPAVDSFHSELSNNRYPGSRKRIHIHQLFSSFFKRNRFTDQLLGFQSSVSDHFEDFRVLVCLHSMAAQDLQLAAHYKIHRDERLMTGLH